MDMEPSHTRTSKCSIVTLPTNRLGQTGMTNNTTRLAFGGPKWLSRRTDVSSTRTRIAPKLKSNKKKPTDPRLIEAAQLALRRVQEVAPLVYSRLVFQVLALRYVNHPKHRQPRLLSLYDLCLDARDDSRALGCQNLVASAYAMKVLQILLSEWRSDQLVESLLTDVHLQWTDAYGYPEACTFERRSCHLEHDNGEPSDNHDDDSRLIDVLAPIVLFVSIVTGALVNCVVQTRKLWVFRVIRGKNKSQSGTVA